MKGITLMLLGLFMSVAMLVGTSGTSLADGAVVNHGDGSTTSFTLNNGNGTRLIYTWTDNPGDIVREKDGSFFYKVNARAADVELQAYSVDYGVWITLGEGTAHLFVSGDVVGGAVGGTTYNFKSHGVLLNTFLPPEAGGIGLGDYTFKVDLIRREGEQKKSVIIVKPAS